MRGRVWLLERSKFTMPRCWRNALGPVLEEPPRECPPPSACVWRRELHCGAGEECRAFLFPAPLLTWEVCASPQRWCFAIARQR